MKILMLGHQSVKTDEGVRKVYRELSERISTNVELLPLDISDMGAMVAHRGTSPDIIHAVIGPSSRLALPMVEVWRRTTEARASVLSAIQCTTNIGMTVAKRARLDLVLVQSPRTEHDFARTGKRCAFLPNGVDTSRFVPVSDEERMAIRRDLGFPEDKRILLHVGPVKRERNAHILSCFADSDTDVLIVSRPSDSGNQELMRDLTRTKCTISTDYWASIEKLYQMSDGYIFPATDPGSCIETPLSVLEACSCNIPVLTTRFGGIPRVLAGVNGVVIADSIDDFVSRRDFCEDFTGGRARTRDAVLNLSWPNICRRIVEMYQEILVERRT